MGMAIVPEGWIISRLPYCHTIYGNPKDLIERYGENDMLGIEKGYVREGKTR